MATDKNHTPRELVTSGELLMDIRNILLLTLPSLHRKRPLWKRRWPYVFLLLLSSLFVIDYGFGTRTNCDLAITDGAEVTLVKMPPPDWKEHGLVPLPRYWDVPNPRTECIPVFEIELTAQTLTYKRTVVRALAQDYADEAALDFRDPPLIIKGPTIIRIKPADMPPEDEQIRKCIIRTYALAFGTRRVPLDTFVDRKTAAGRLVLETIPTRGWRRFKANLARALALIPKTVERVMAK